jgi:hypothetical protein
MWAVEEAEVGSPFLAGSAAVVVEAMRESAAVQTREEVAEGRSRIVAEDKVGLVL